MNCPNCGNEIRPGEKFCQSCGTQLPELVNNTVPPAYRHAAAVPGKAMTLKEFVESPHCTPDVNKNIKGSWIALFVCAGLSIAVALVNGISPIDGIIIAGLAVWLLLTKSVAAGVTAGIVGIIEMVVSSIAMGQVAGYLPAIAGIYAMTSVLNGNKQFKAFKANGSSGANTTQI